MIIYLARNRINGECYVGQTMQRLSQRMYSHRCCSKSPGKRSKFHRAIAKHGWEAFEWEVLEETDEVGLDMAERFWITTYNSLTPNGYNLETGGHGNKRHSSESRTRMSVAKKGRADIAEHCKALGAARVGKTLSAEHRAAMSAGHVGRVVSQETRQLKSENRQGDKSLFAKLTWEEVRSIRTLYAEGSYTYAELATRFGVSLSNVALIVKHKSWSPDPLLAA